MGENQHQQEKKYALVHFFFVAMVTGAIFFLSYFANYYIHPTILIVRVLFLILSVVSLLYCFASIQKFSIIISLFRYILLFCDLFVLTVSIDLLKDQGVVLLPLYIFLMMQGGITFGVRYFYMVLFFSSVSWGWLVYFSEYWHNHVEPVIVFAMAVWLMSGYMHQIYSEVYQSLSKTSQDVYTDGLTGLFNRKYFNQYFNKILKRKKYFAILFIDLNKFKVINDTYGHDIGDEVLKEVAKRLSKHINKEDMLARLGGDEFVILTKRKRIFLAKFLDLLERDTVGEHIIGKVSVFISLSIGVSIYPDDSKVNTNLLKYADKAMYCAKKRVDTYHVFYEEIKSSEDFC